jgi:RHO1 GDP-GTP exchange protein 1/2
MSHLRAHSPVDEELQRLYNDVWSGYAEEKPVRPREGDLDDIYNVYGRDSAPPIPPKPHIPTAMDGSQNRRYHWKEHQGT